MAQNGVSSQALIATKLANSPKMTCMAEDDLRAVERRMELADAKLGVAVNLGWVAAGFAARSRLNTSNGLLSPHS